MKWTAVLQVFSVSCRFDLPELPEMPFGCGDGILDDEGEFCDDGNLVDGDGCDSNCMPTGCGNSIPTEGEQCDDGNHVAQDCSYGEPSCTNCDSSCQLVPAEFCGDGIRQTPFEICDDGNRVSCGTCSLDCQIPQSARANGTMTMVSGADLVDSDMFTLYDGITVPLTFEFTKDGIIDVGNFAINITSSDTSAAIADMVQAEINNIGYLITATRSGATVFLTHNRSTSLGNQLIFESVNHPNFTVNGMSGGKGGDCDSGQDCRSNEDCASNLCSQNVCL